jgi:hypothetical protein
MKYVSEIKNKKTKTYHTTVGAIPKLNIKIVERGKFNIHNRGGSRISS